MDEQDTSQGQPEEAVGGGEALAEGETPSEQAVEQPSDVEQEAGDVQKPRTYTEDEWNKRQSEIDKQVAEISKQNKQFLELFQQQQRQQQVGQGQNEYAQFMQNIAMQEAELVRKAESGELEAPQLARMLAERERAFVQATHKMWQEQTQTQTNTKIQSVQNLITKYGLTETDMPLLFQSPNPELQAENIALRRNDERLKAEIAQKQRQPQDFSPAVQMGSGDSDDAFMKQYADPDYEPTEADTERMLKILEK